MRKSIIPWVSGIVLVCVIFAGASYLLKSEREKKILRQIIERLTAETRIAEVVVTRVSSDPVTGKTLTTIKFLEYDTRLKPLRPKYFTFSGDIIQFQTLVIRFDDFYVKKGDRLRGKSAYLFMKAFCLTEKGAEKYTINDSSLVPSGYALQEGAKNSFERRIWRKFWQYALNPKEASQVGIKNAQIEAPGTKFIPGLVYIIKVEHDGGIRIDAQNLPYVLKGEKIQF